VYKLIILMESDDSLIESLVIISGLPSGIRLLRLRHPETQTLVKKQCDLWAFVWTAGSVLAEIAASLTPCVASPLVSVEIGCGSGLASLAISRAGGHAIATDLVADALLLLDANASRNDIKACAHDSPPRAGTLCTQRMDWNAADAAHTLHSQCATSSSPDVVMGADVLFASSHIRPVLKLLSDLLSHEREAVICSASGCAQPPPLAIIVDPGRFSCDDFEDAAPTAGLRVLLRADIPGLPTPIARMKLCTIFLLASEVACSDWQRSGMEAAGGADPAVFGAVTWPLLEAATTAVRRLEARACTSDATSSEQKFGYTLPSVSV
jgi:predicted nicotinamide N-methyase